MPQASPWFYSNGAPETQTTTRRTSRRSAAVARAVGVCAVSGGLQAAVKQVSGVWWRLHNPKHGSMATVQRVFSLLRVNSSANGGDNTEEEQLRLNIRSSYRTLDSHSPVDSTDTTAENQPQEQWSGRSLMSPSLKGFSCDFDPATKKGRSLVLQFDLQGNSSFREMSRADILQLTREASMPTDNGSSNVDQQTPDIQVVNAAPTEAQFNLEAQKLGYNPRHSSFRMGEMGYATVCDVQRVHARDLRKLDATFAVSNEPSIVVRKQAILLNVDPIRAVILRERCLVFVPDGADGLISTLRTKFQDTVTNEESEQVAYEFKALEAVLSTLSSFYEYDYEKNAPPVMASLEKLAGGNIATKELETLRVFKNAMNEFESQVDGIRRCLMELLDSEDDLRLLYLTKLHNDPTLLQDLWCFDSEEAEMLIENYLQDIVTVHTKAHLMLQRVQTTESVVMMKLDAARNYLLGVDLVFGLIAIGVSIGTFVTGAFGMNLDFDMPYKDQAFWWVVLITFLFGVIVVIAGIIFFRRKGIFSL